MHNKQISATALLVGALAGGWHVNSFAVDSASLEFATGNKSKIVRAGLQWDWASKWFESNGTNLGGYWDLTAAQVRENRYQSISGNSRNIYDIGITPVFRFQSDSKMGPYAEAGIGAHYFSDLYDNNSRRWSTRFEFGDHLGIGYVFASKWDVGLKVQHFSNGGIKKPNSGANFAVLKVGYRF